MAVIGTAFIAIKPDMKGFGKQVGDGVSKGVGSKAEETGKKTGGRFSKAFKGAAALGGVAAAAGVVSFGKASVDAARESEVAQARLGNVFSSMGDKTGSATKSAIKYAGALQKQTAIDDETIINAQAKIATFGKVSDATARQEGIFDRTTKAAADLAAAGFGSMSSNATSLGKALQDPEKGIAALARSGVTFTKQEKEKIKVLMASGRQTEAQKMILGAVEKQVGGTAAATATASDKMSNAWGEAQESVGKVLLPILEKLANFTTNTLIPAFQKFMSWIEKNKRIVGPLAVGILAVVAAVKLINGAQKAWTAASKAWSAVTKVATGVQAAFNAVMDANPIVLVVIGIAALVAAVIIAYKKVGWFHDAVDALWQGVQKAFDVILNAAKAVLRFFTNNWKTIIAVITGPIGLVVLLITKNWNTIKAITLAVWNGIKAAVGVVVRAIQTVITAVWNGIKTAVGAVINAIKGVVTRAWFGIKSITLTVWNAIKTAITTIVNGIKAVIGAVWNGIKTVVTNYLNGLKIIITGAWNTLKRVTSGAFNAIRNIISGVWNGIKNTARNGVNGVIDIVRGIPAKVRSIATSLYNAGKDIGGQVFAGMKAVFSGAVGGVGDVASKLANAVLGAWNNLARRANDLIPNNFGPIPFPDNPIPILHFAKGGLVPGRAGAPLLAVVHGGEFVVPEDRVGRGGSAVGVASAVTIAEATFNEPVDVDVLINRVNLALASGRL